MNTYICDIANADASDDRPLNELLAALASIGADLVIRNIGYDDAHETAYAEIYSDRTGRCMIDLPTTPAALAEAFSS